MISRRKQPGCIDIAYPQPGIIGLLCAGKQHQTTDCFDEPSPNFCF